MSFEEQLSTSPNLLNNEDSSSPLITTTPIQLDRIYQHCLQVATDGVKRLQQIRAATNMGSHVAANVIIRENNNEDDSMDISSSKLGDNEIHTSGVSIVYLLHDVVEKIRALGAVSDCIKKAKLDTQYIIDEFTVQEALCQRRIAVLQTELAEKKAVKYPGLDKVLRQQQQQNGVDHHDGSMTETDEILPLLEEENKLRDLRVKRLEDLNEQLRKLNDELGGLNGSAVAALPLLESALASVENAQTLKVAH